MKKPGFVFALMLGAFVALALAYSIVIPLGEAPDEVSHWAYIQALLTEGQLPKPEGAAVGEAYQPPLYYLLGALVSVGVPPTEYQIVANPDFAPENPAVPNLLLHPRAESFPYRGAPLAWHLTRALSIALGALTVWTTWQIAREIFPAEPGLALGAATFVAFLPGFIALSAVVNNDNLVIALASLGILQSIRMMRLPHRTRDAIWLGIVLGLALLAKLNALVVWIFAAMLLSFRTYQTREWRNAAITFGWCFGVALALAAPWMIYNVRAYGDPFGWSLYRIVGTVRPTPMTLGEWIAAMPPLVTSFWGRLGGMLNLSLPAALYIGLNGLVIIALSGWGKILRASFSLEMTRRARGLLAIFAVFWVPLLIVYVQWARNDYAPDQARRLFPGLALFAIVLVTGFVQLAGTHKARALTLWSGGFFALAVSVLMFLNASYTVAPEKIEELERLGGISAPADFGAMIRIVDFRVEPIRVAPGERVGVQVYWQALQAPSENYWLLLQIANADGVIANQDGVPSAGRLTTDWWRKDAVFVSQHTITVPEATRAGKYIFRLGLHPYGKWEWLPVRGREMLTLATIEVVER